MVGYESSKYFINCNVMCLNCIGVIVSYDSVIMGEYEHRHCIAVNGQWLAISRQLCGDY